MLEMSCFSQLSLCGDLGQLCQVPRLSKSFSDQPSMRTKDTLGVHAAADLKACT